MLDRQNAIWQLNPLFLRRGALVIESEQPLQEFRIGERGRPAMGGEDGLIQFAVSIHQPGGARVVEIREGAALQFFRAGVWWIEPCVPLLHQLARGLCDCFHQRRVFLLMARRPGNG